MRQAPGVLLLAGLLVLAGCSRGPKELRPPQIRYDRDVCVECDMIISEERFATAYLTPEGETRLFDDIGDMLLYMSKHKEAVAAPFVHDFETREWLPAQAGFYVRTDYVHSPMGWNIAAFADEAKARAFAEQTQGVFMTWRDLLKMDLTLPHINTQQ